MTNLHVPERGFSCADGEKCNGLVDAAEGRDVDGLPAHSACGSDTCAVFAGPAVDDGVDGDLQGVGVGSYVDLWMTWALIYGGICMARIDHGAKKASAMGPFEARGIGKRACPTISKACATIRTAMSFFPLLRPFIISELVRRSTIGHWALRKRLTA